MSALTTRQEEIAFGVGTFGGVLLFAFGVAMFILGATTGVRSGTYLSPTLKWGLVAVGVVAAVIGIVVYVRGSQLRNDAARAKRTVGGGLVLLTGIYITAFALSPQTTLSAPFISSPRQKVLFFCVSFVAICVGAALIRRSARIVGW